MPAVPPPIVTLSAIDPEVAVMAPVIVAFVAVRAPALVTLNGDDPKLAFPACNPVPGISPIVLFPVPPVKAVEERVQPPTVPEVAVTAPSCVILKGALVLFARVLPAKIRTVPPPVPVPSRAAILLSVPAIIVVDAEILLPVIVPPSILSAVTASASSLTVVIAPSTINCAFAFLRTLIFVRNHSPKLLNSAI